MGCGFPLVVEVKGGQNAITSLGSHVNEMLTEVANADARMGVVIAKRRRSGKVGDWFAVMTVDQWLDLILDWLDP